MLKLLGAPARLRTTIDQLKSVIDDEARRLDEREAAAAAQMKDLDARDKALDAREAQVQALEVLVATALSEGEAKLAEERASWDALAAKLEASLTPDRIKMDVGGKIFAAGKSTLTSRPETFFGAMFSGRFPMCPQDDGTYFIDRDPSVFGVVLNFLRGVPPDLDGMLEREVAQLKTDADYFQICDLVDMIDSYLNVRFLVQTSLSLTFSNQECCAPIQSMNAALAEWLPGKWCLQYRGSRDGFQAASFHSKCDGKGASLVVCKSTNGHVFGGYTQVGFQSSMGNWVPDECAFLFTLSNAHGIAPTKLALKPDRAQNGIYHHFNCGPTFGGRGLCRWGSITGHDLRISDNSNMNTSSTSNLGNCYADVTGKGQTLFAGASPFQLSEIEVFILQQ